MYGALWFVFSHTHHGFENMEHSQEVEGSGGPRCTAMTSANHLNLLNLLNLAGQPTDTMPVYSRESSGAST